MEIATSYAFTQPSSNGALNPRYTFNPWQHTNGWFYCLGNCDVSWSLPSRTCTNGTMYILGPAGFGWAWQNSTSGEPATIAITQTKAALKDMNQKWLDLKNESFEYMLQLACNEGTYRSVNFTIHLNNWNYGTGARADMNSSTTSILPPSSAISAAGTASPTATATSSHTPSIPPNNRLSAGAIVGIAIGVVALLFLLMAFCLIRRHKQKRYLSDSHSQPQLSDNGMAQPTGIDVVTSPAKPELAASVNARGSATSMAELSSSNNTGLAEKQAAGPKLSAHPRLDHDARAHSRLNDAAELG